MYTLLPRQYPADAHALTYPEIWLSCLSLASKINVELGSGSGFKLRFACNSGERQGKVLAYI